MKDNLPVLYIKTGCPWCESAVEFMSRYGITYRERNVTEDPEARAEMRRVSGQDSAPVLDWNGQVLADFGLDELKPFLRGHNVQFEDS